VVIKCDISAKGVKEARLKIAVLIKQVPVVSVMKFNNDSRRVEREGAPVEINPYDVIALSLAANLRQSFGFSFDVYTMGPPQANTALIQALAMGAENAIHLNDPHFAGSDTLATSRALSEALLSSDYDLILCGLNSVDAETGQVGPETAAMMGIPHITSVRSLQIDDKTIRAEQITDYGYDIVQCDMPVLITVTEGVADEQYPSRSARNEASEKPIKVVTASDLHSDVSKFGVSGSPTWVNDVYPVELNRDKYVIESQSPRIMVDRLIGYLNDRRLSTEGQLGSIGDGLNRGEHRDRGEVGSIVVVAEIVNETIKPVTFELLGRATELADELGTNVEVLAIGKGIDKFISHLGAFGADVVIVSDNTALEYFHVSLYADVLRKVIISRSPFAVLLGATSMGRDLASYVSALLELGLTGDCIGLNIDPLGRLEQLKPAFGGNIVAPILSKTKPNMATVRPGTFKPCKPDFGIHPKVEYFAYDSLLSSPIEVVRRIMDVSPEFSNLESSSIVVGVGKGIGGTDQLGIIREFSSSIGAAIGATRDVTEEGWLPRQCQIGLSGRSISPNLYYAVGIRGAFNHTVGIINAGTVVAINNDPRAPIFNSADIGIVGDFRDILPLLTEALDLKCS